MAEIITLTVKQVGVSEAEKSLNNMLTTIKAINSTPINVSVTGSGAKAAEQYKETVTATQTEVKKLSQSFKETEKSGDSLLKNVIKNAQWYYISGAVSAATRSFKDAIAAMKEADAEMVSIQKVTGYTKEQMDRLSDSAYSLASAYGRTAQEILSAETTFARAGYTDQIEDLAELAVLTQNVGDVNADTASKFLIAADAAWKLGGNEKELTEIIDGMNNVTNKNAVDMKALTEGLTVSASAFAEAGESAQTYTAMVGAGVAATQRSGNEVARAMRTIIMNVRQIRGETEDGELIDNESIANAAKALKEYADISTLQNGELRQTYDVLDELAGKWETLGSVAKSAITEALAGKYRANILSALLNDWDSVSKMMQDYADGVGSALEENEFYLQSWDAKTKKLQSTWTEFVAKTVDEDWIKGLISSVTWLIEGVGSLGNALLILGGVIATFKMPSILSFLSSAVSGIGRLVAMIKLATTNFTAFSLVANTTQLAIGAITAAITIGIVAYNKYKQAQEEAQQSAIDAGKSATEEAKSFEELYAAYQNADKAYSDGTGSKKEFESATYDLLDAIGFETSAIDEQITRYGSLKAVIDANKGAVTELMQAKIESALYDAKAATAAASDALLGTHLSYHIYGYNPETYEGTTADERVEYYEKLIAKRNELIDAGDTESSYYKRITKLISELKPFVDEYNTALENQTYLENLAEDAKDGFIDSYKEETEAISDNTDAQNENAEASGTQTTALEEAGKALKTQQDNLKTAMQAMAEYRANGKLSSDTLQSLISMSSEYSSILVKQDGTLNLTEESLRDLSEAIQENIKQTQNQIGATASADSAAESYVSALLKIGEAAGQSGKQLYELVLEEIKLNSTGLDLSAQIAQVIALGRAAGATAASIASIAGVKTQDAERTIKGWLQTGQVKSYEEGESKLLQRIYDSFDFSDADWSSSTSTSGGGGGSSSDANLSAHKEKVSLLKSELTLMEKQGASEEDQKNKMRQIQQALHAQAQYLRSIGGSQADINDLSAEWWEWQEKINGELKSTDDLLDELKNALQESIDAQKDALDDQLAALDAELDALKKRKESKDDELTLEEKILAVQQAQADLADAQNERTIRQYNARSGQWEWVADEKNIQSAEEALDKAKKDLEDFKDDLEYNAAVADIEARKDAIKAQQDELDRQYKKLTDALKEKTRGIGEILQDIWKNATPELKAIILENAEIFKQFGIDVSQLSDAVNETAQKLYGISKNGDRYEIGSDRGIDFVNNAKPGETITGSDGSTWTKNADGTVTIVDKDGITYVVNPGGGSSGGSSSGGGGSSGGKHYTAPVYAEPDSGHGDPYVISSSRGINFLNNEPAGANMTGGDGSYWYKNYDGTTSITDKYGNRYTVYDRGGVLRGMGGIKATSANEMVLPPDITARMLAPTADERFEQRIRELGFIYGATGNQRLTSGARFDNNSIETQHNGNVYQIGGISISEGKARTTSVYDLAQMARTLTISNND